MKKIIIVIVLLFVACVSLAGCETKKTEADYLRIHIRANSNDEKDQSIKLVVKEKIVAEMTPFLAEASTKEQAISILSQRVEEMKAVADKTLSDNGFDYKSTVRVCKENFPSRSYGELTLGSGVYDALIIELGSGEGNNWWCVVFPPLCFVAKKSSDDDKIVYKSLIKEWLTKAGVFNN